MRQVNKNLNNNNIEKGKYIKDNIQSINKNRVSVYLSAEDRIHEVSRAD
jgi:hypothetical protein